MRITLSPPPCSHPWNSECVMSISQVVSLTFVFQITVKYTQLQIFHLPPPLSVKSIHVVVQLTSTAVLISRTKTLCPLNKNCLFLPPHSPWWPHRTDCLYESDYSGCLMQGESQYLSGFFPSASCPQGSFML